MSIEWANQTTLHPLGLSMVLLMGLVLLCVPRRYATWPILVIACFVPPAQRLVVFGLDFNLLRIMVVFSWARILLRKEHAVIKWILLDTVIVAWSAVTLVNYSALQGSMSAFVYQLGMIFDAVGMYFSFRCLIRDWSDLELAAIGAAILSVPVSLLFLVEASTGRNMFATFGGVPAITIVREGRLRCQGAFAHSILAGCFWASLMPMIAVLCWRRGMPRMVGVAGLVCSLLVIVACASSTPVMAIIFGLVAAALYRARRHMRALRWGLALTLVVLHFAMSKPVWHLIARVNVVAGSTSWHRFNVIDQAIRNVSEWWLIGTNQIDHWNISANDITNHFVLEAVLGGLARLALFIAIVCVAFAYVGRIWRSAGTAPRTAMAWALGVSLFVHVTNFLGVSYFGQIMVIWYLLLASIGSMSVSGTIALPTPATRGLLSKGARHRSAMTAGMIS